MNEEQENEFNQIISDALNIDFFSYNSEVTDQVWGVIRLMGEAREKNDSIFNTEIAKQLGITEAHAELIQYLVCNNDNADYGTSPRGAWLTDKGFELYKTLKGLGPDGK